MKSNFSRTFRLNSWIATKQYQKRVTETKFVKIPNGILKTVTFHPMIAWVYNNHYEILLFHWVFSSAKLKEKTCQKVSLWQYDQLKKCNFDDLFSRAIFAFWLKKTIPEKIYIFWRWDEQKFCNYLWRFSYTKETLSPGQQFFFRSTLFSKSFSKRPELWFSRRGMVDGY